MPADTGPPIITKLYRPTSRVADPDRIRIILLSWILIWISIRVKSWIRIRIKVEIQKL